MIKPFSVTGLYQLLSIPVPLLVLTFAFIVINECSRVRIVFNRRGTEIQIKFIIFLILKAHKIVKRRRKKKKISKISRLVGINKKRIHELIAIQVETIKP